MPGTNGQEIQKILNNKAGWQQVLFVNLVISIFMFVLSSLGNLNNKATEKILFSIGGIMLGASIFEYARKFDDLEDAQEYQNNLQKEDFKEELDSDIAVRQKVREQTEQIKVFKSIEKELSDNPTFKLLIQKRKEALDQVNDDEPQDDKTAFDVINEQSESKPEPDSETILTDEQFQQIVKLNSQIGIVAAVQQVTGLNPDSPQWKQIKEELQRRLNQNQ